jgi:DnaA family protein
MELFPVTDNNHEEAIRFITKIKSLNLGDNEINYLMTHSKRNVSNLVEIIEKLDKLSLQLKRKITIPLIKKVI